MKMRLIFPRGAISELTSADVEDSKITFGNVTQRQWPDGPSPLVDGEC